jgi:hypothetical protein
MTPPQPCPDSDTWVRFLRGLLTPEQSDGLGGHLRQCTRCVGLISGLPIADPLLDQLRQGVRQASHLAALIREPAHLNALLETTVAAAQSSTMPWSQPLSFLTPSDDPTYLGWLGAYPVLGVLGQGGMGVVLEAEYSFLLRRVAIKVLLPALRDRPELHPRERFIREARALAAVRHPNVVTVHDGDTIDGLPFVVMERLRGETLARRLQRGPVELAKALQIGREIALGLEAIHQAGLIHRDLKPGNVWLEESSDHVKLLDFGLARSGDADQLTRPGTFLGTPAYIAPETLDSPQYTPQSDLFGFGVLLYQMTTGRLPFAGESPVHVLINQTVRVPSSPRAVNPRIPVPLARLILELLAKKPQQRPASAAAVARRLEEMVLCRQPTRPLRALAAVACAGALAVGFLLGAAMRNPGPAFRPVGPAPTVSPLPDGWVDRVSVLKPADKAQAVEVALKELNPEWKGTFEATLNDAGIHGIVLQADGLQTLEPLRSVPELQSLECRASAPGGSRLQDLSPLHGCSLRWLVLHNTEVRNLQPLARQPIAVLQLAGSAVDDLAPLHDLPLKTLILSGCPVKDLGALKDRPHGRRLKALALQGTRVRSLEPLRGLALEELYLNDTMVSELEPLTGMPLRTLHLTDTRVKDLSPLRSLPLRELNARLDTEEAIELVRGLSALERINDVPAQEFWLNLQRKKR